MGHSGGKAYMHLFDAIGEEYASYCMQSDISGIRDFIQTQDDSKLVVMLLAAMIKRLGNVRDEVRGLARFLSRQVCDQETDGLADGMLMVLRANSADVPIALCDQSGLSIRARKALRNGQFQSLAEITEDAVVLLKNCGPSTSMELQDWKRVQYERLSGSNGTRSGSLDTGG